MRAADALRHFCSGLEIPESAQQQLALALEESCSNIVNHAYLRDTQKTFLVKFSFNGNELTIELRDRGPPFDPKQALQKMNDRRDDDRVGGWGLPLVERSVDTWDYRRENDENVLRLTKQVDMPAGDAGPTEIPQS